MIEPPSFNGKLVDMAYEEMVDGNITLEEYEERLDWYMTDEIPPKRIHRKDFFRLVSAVVDDEMDMLLGHEYRLMDGGEWYGRVEERV